MADVVFWLLPHLLCILIHGGMLMAAFTCFVLTSQRVVRDGSHDMDLTPFGAFAAAVCGFAVNWTLFSHLLRLERPLAAGASETPRSIRFKKVVTMLIGQVANLAISAVDLYVGWLAASHSALGNSSWSLTLVAVLATIGGATTLVTIAVDTKKIIDVRKTDRQFATFAALDSIDARDDEENAALLAELDYD